MESSSARLFASLRGSGLASDEVLDAMERVPRHLCVSESMRDLAYFDSALPIEAEQTMSQPTIVAIMTTAASERTRRRHKALEIGTGSGYQAAVLAHIYEEVYSVERIKSLCDSATDTLQRLNISNVRVRHADGWEGWEEAGPFDAIVVTAAASRVPRRLKEQLAVGGRLVVPVNARIGDDFMSLRRPLEDEVVEDSLGQKLLVLTRVSQTDFQTEDRGDVRFVPMLTGLT